jgi:Protein of Unknown function (DUF2784)
MVFRMLADLVVVVHLAFVLFVAVGGILVWLWPRLVRAHLPAVAWGVAIVAIGFTCPLTPLEHRLRELGGERGPGTGFIDRYVEGVLYPGDLTPVVRALIATGVVVGYAGALRRWRRARAADAEGTRGSPPLSRHSARA